MIFDAMLCVAEQHIDIAAKAIRSLRLFTSSRNIYVITSDKNRALIEQRLDRQDLKLTILNEDQFIPGIDLATIQGILQRKIGSPHRGGWYFQQFLKMQACRLPDIADRYLIWDSDTILLKPLEFFDQQGRILIAPSRRYHKPYFEAINRLFGLDKQKDYSFVTEHLMVCTAFMMEILKCLEASAAGEVTWVETIMEAVSPSHLATTGFSEYETYGTYVSARYPDSFTCRELKGTRKGAISFGMQPDARDLFALMQNGYAYATFEAYMPIQLEMSRHNKAMARAIWESHQRRIAELAAAETICRKN